MKYTANVKETQVLKCGIKIEPNGGTVTDSQARAIASDPWGKRLIDTGKLKFENAISKLTGVTYARVYSNRNIIEASGRPPKSYEAVVVGGDAQTIAETIFANGPAGIQAYGNTVQTVKDSQGYDWDVGFSRPVNRNIWIKIILTLYDEEEFPAGGAAAIKSNIVSWGAENLGVAVDLIFQRLAIPVYEVPGIAHAEIKVAATLDPDTPPDTSEYASANIAVGEVEIAVLDESRISVEVAG